MSAKVVELPDPAPVPATVTVEIRGQRFTFRELEISEYDKLVKQASHQEADVDGILQDVTDNTLLLKLMVLKSCVSPKLTDSILTAYGYRMYRAIARIVNELHYGDEPVKQVKDDDEAAPEEETPKGND
jgi:DNA integrity scanning protein DisA with diadenylate cyclase activity